MKTPSIGDFKTLVKNMKDAMSKVQLMEMLGGFKKELEVKKNSLVQVLIKIPIEFGGHTHYDWMFTQTWFANLTPEEQGVIAGAYWGEEVGNIKVIGIYEPQPGLEVITKVPDFQK